MSLFLPAVSVAPCSPDIYTFTRNQEIKTYHSLSMCLRSNSSYTVTHTSGKKVQIRKPAPGQSDIAPLRRSSRPVIISSSTLKKSPAQHRPLRERLIHLLALKPYKKPELILRLQKDGLLPSDKDSLDSHLQQVTLALTLAAKLSSLVIFGMQIDPPMALVFSL